MNAVNAPSQQPDLRIVGRLLTAQSACFVIAGTIATVVLFDWLVPAIGSALPGGWSLMKVNTALAILLSIASLLLTQPERSDRRRLEGRTCAVLVVFLAGTALLEHLSGRAFGLDTLLAADSGATNPGRMSFQTASFLVLLGLTLLLDRKTNNAWRHVADALTLALVAVLLVAFAGYAFDAPDLFGQASNTRTAPQTIVCLALLAFAVVVRRTKSGLFSVFVGVGIGSQIARLGWPFALLLPFLFIRYGAYMVEAGWLSVPYGAGLTAAAISILLLPSVILMARTVNLLELELRNRSLTDELTKLHNRRSFNTLGEQVLRETRRAVSSLTVLYFDLDGLKKVNDTLGHEVGSQLLFDFATLLRTNFRDSDVVARVGGDEFAVVTLNGQAEFMTALLRLEGATAAANRASGKPYQISYSVGEAISEPTDDESFAELVARADALMYERKRLRKGQQEARPAA